MASKDKVLARVSEWSTLAVLAGVAGLALVLPQDEVRHDPTAAPPRVETPPAAQAPADAAADTVPVKPVATQQASPPAETVVVDAWTDAEQAAGLRECLRLLAPIAAEVELDEPIKKGPCGTPAPLLLRSVGSSAKVEFRPAPKMNCRLAAHMARWIDTILQPAAREVLGSRVTRIVGASSYSCRNIYNKPDLPLSQHATGNAVDIAGFVTADGRRISVAKGWGPTERDIAAAQEKAAQAATAAANTEHQKSAKDAATTSSEKKRPEDAKVHKAGVKADERVRSSVVPAAAALSAAKTAESAFLKRLHSGACTVFGTVLGPEANEAHRDHFHLDAKERKRHGVCH